MTGSPPPAHSPYLTVGEVAGRLRLSRFTIYRMVNAGQFPGTVRTLRAYRIPETAVVEYLHRHEVGD